MNKSVTPPCEHLTFTFNYELQHGNSVAVVKEMAEHRRHYFAQKLKIWGTPATGDVGQYVEYWDSLGELGLTADECELMDDPPHVESGFRCSVHGHIIAGPAPP